MKQGDGSDVFLIFTKIENYEYSFCGRNERKDSLDLEDFREAL